MRGPTAFASHSGSRFHVSIASWNFGFFGRLVGHGAALQQDVLPMERHG